MHVCAHPSLEKNNSLPISIFHATEAGVIGGRLQITRVASTGAESQAVGLVTEERSTLGDVMREAVAFFSCVAIDPGFGALGIIDGTDFKIIRIVVVGAEFPDVTRHVVELELIRWIAFHW